MLPKHSRLSREEFTAAFKAARRVRTPGVQVLFVPPVPHRTALTESVRTFATAVVVSKKVAKLAVRRNYLRRRVYAHMATLKKSLGLQGIYIVILLTEAKTMPIEEILASVTHGISALSQKGASR